jgi:hypothetical protein
MDDLQSRFGGLDSMFDDLQREMDQAFQGMPAPGRLGQPGQMQPGQGGFSNSESKSYSMQVDPDGVKVEVSQDVNGKKETQTYTAKTLDELYAAHPELKDQLGLHVDMQSPHGFGFQSGRNDPFGGLRGFSRDDQDRPAIPLQPGAMRTDVLGVRVSTPTQQDRTAAKVDDVRDILHARKDGGDVAVTVVDEQGQKRVLTWRASSERQL